MDQAQSPRIQETGLTRLSWGIYTAPLKALKLPDQVMKISKQVVWLSHSYLEGPAVERQAAAFFEPVSKKKLYENYQREGLHNGLAVSDPYSRLRGSRIRTELSRLIGFEVGRDSGKSDRVGGNLVSRLSFYEIGKDTDVAVILNLIGTTFFVGLRRKSQFRSNGK